MLAIRTKQRKWIIFLIIVASAVTGYKVSGFRISPVKEPTVNTKEAENVFNTANNYNKIRMNYLVSDLAATKDKFSYITSLDSVNKKYLLSTNNGLVSILEVSPSSYNGIRESLRNIPGLINERSTQTPKEPIIDINSRVRQNRMTLSRLEDRRTSPNLTTRDIRELDRSIQDVQTTIDSLSNIQAFEENRNNNLILATIVLRSTPLAGGTTRQYINLTVALIISLFVYTVLTIVIYICYELLNRLLSLVGIKSARKRSRYGHYSYSQYNSGYSYGYGDSSKRKKKRTRNNDTTEITDNNTDK